MIVYKCKNCNGEMSVDASGALCCEYCGSKGHFSDKELQGYKEFRMQMLNYLRSLHDIEKDDAVSASLWDSAEEKVYMQENGVPVTIHYIYLAEEAGVTMYLTRNAVLYHFKNRDEAEKMERSLGRLEFPPADIKGLQRCFPKLKGRFQLKKGEVLLAYDREPMLFPLSLFGALSARHVAWIISRMENICCVLEYNGLTHGGISMDHLFINPKTHEAMLYGGWNQCKEKTRDILGDSVDLKELRKLAKRLLGVHPTDVPGEFEKFLEEYPKKDAYEDFARWDEVIEKGFGGRSFTQMKLGEVLKQ